MAMFVKIPGIANQAPQNFDQRVQSTQRAQKPDGMSGASGVSREPDSFAPSQGLEEMSFGMKNSLEEVSFHISDSRPDSVATGQPIGDRGMSIDRSTPRLVDVEA